MIVSINYANTSYKKHQDLNAFSAKYIAKVNKVICFKPEDIDKQFREKYDTILSTKRGNGLWLWKPYIICKTLETLNQNDYLIYTDSGIFYFKKIQGLIDKLEESKQDIMLFDLPLLEVQWTKKDVFDALNDQDNKFTNQRNGAVIIVKNTSNARLFIKNWLDLCCNSHLLLPPNNTNNQEDFLFIENREDQSILSVLSKKMNIESFSDPTDYGKLPYLYLSTSKLLNVKSYTSKFFIKDTFFIHHRGKNILTYIIKYLIRYYMMVFIDPHIHKKTY